MINSRKFGRRKVPQGATTLQRQALLGAARAALPSGAFAQAAGVENQQGDSWASSRSPMHAPLIIAKEKKIFDKYGITVRLTSPTAKPASWGTTRGTTWCWARQRAGIDGAHILTPFPY